MEPNSGEMKEGRKDSVKLVQDITKLLITLATGVLTLSATFLNNIVGDYPTSEFLIFVSWILITLSIVAGIFTLSSLVNLLKNDIYEPFAPQTTAPAIIQWITFVVGITFFWIFVIVNLN